MANLSNWRILGLGLLSWLVPFVVSFAFFDSSGALSIPEPLFKSIMVVVFGGFGVLLLTIAFRRVAPAFRSGLAIGLLWLAINAVLDVIVLLPLAGMSLPDWLVGIGLRYLLIPIIAAGMGLVAERVSGTS